MASTYSPSLRLELMATGDQSGTWGTTTNTNLGTLLEQAITGYLSVAQGDVANLTLTTVNGGTDQARNAVVNLTGAMTAARNVVVQTAAKVYLIKNNTTGGFNVTAKTAAGTGVEIAPGTARWVYSDGTNVVDGQPGLWMGYATTATAAGTTTLTVGSAYYQYFTGATTQTITLPVASTLTLGQAFYFVNLSSGALTVNSSGGNLVATIGASSSAIVQCILTSGTGAASWNAVTVNLSAYLPLAGGTMTGQLINTGSSVSYTPIQLISTEAAAAAGPIIDLYRNSASPAAADLIGEIDFTGQNSTPAKKTYAYLGVRIDTATAASEAATFLIATMKGGTLTNYLTPGANAAGTATASAVGLPQGQLSFPATQNPSSDANTLDDYEEGTTTPTVTATSGTFTSATCSLSYTKVGNRVDFDFVVTITTVGTASGTVFIDMPFTPVTGFGFGGREPNTTGFAVTGSCAAGGTSTRLGAYDGSSIIGAGRALLCSGSFHI